MKCGKAFVHCKCHNSFLRWEVIAGVTVPEEQVYMSLLPQAHSSLRGVQVKLVNGKTRSQRWDM